MKFIISRSELSNLIKKIQSVAPSTAPIPILSHILVEVEDELVVTATDLTVGIRCSSPAKISSKGSISIPSKRFFNLIRELTDSNLEVSAVDNEMVEIKTGSSTFRLLGMSKEEYPSIPDLSDYGKVIFKTDQLKEVFNRTSFAVSKEDNRHILTGVLMQLKGNIATFVGTDGKRLAKTDIEIPQRNDYFDAEYVIPIKAVDEFTKNFGEDDLTTVYLGKEKVAFESGNILMVTRLLAGEYPDFEQVISTQSKITLSLHREELIVLLKQVSLFTSEISHSVKFTFNNGELILTANCAEIGEGKVSMPLNYYGERLQIAFNPFFFLDILRHSKDECVALGISDPYNPGVITDSTTSLFVIMPMRLHDE